MIGEMLWSYRKNFVNSSGKETGPSYGQKVVSLRNPNKNNWQNLKKYSKLGQDFKNLISNLAWFLRAIINI